MCHGLWDVLFHWQGGYYYIALTHWSLTLEMLASVLLVAATVRARRELTREGPRKTPKEPLICRLAVAVFTLQVPLALMVVFMYWSLDNPIWALPPGYTADYDNLYIHGFNCMWLLIAFFVSRVPYKFANSGWLIIFAVIYIGWTYLHFLLRIGTGFPCPNYEMRDCPIYNVFDWHNKTHTLLLGAGLAFVGCPLMILLSWCMGMLRDRVDSAYQHNDGMACNSLSSSESDSDNNVCA